MPLSVVGRVSADNGNLLQAGSDGGLFMPANPLRGPASAYVIDNSWAGPASGVQYWYTAQASSSSVYNSAIFPVGYGVIWPMAFARDCTIGTSVIRNAATTTSSPSVYLAMYANNAATGLPGAKIVDLLSWGVSTALATSNSTQLNASPVFKAGTLYWACTWTVGTTTPNLYCMYGLPGTIRSTGTQQVLSLIGSSPNVAYVDNVSSFTTATGPAVLAPNTDSMAISNMGQTGQYVPRIYWGLTNV